jgi:teichuronic acid biosynthesis glycosyltransferase TuaG
MVNHLVSIITPSYNSENFIKDTIDSVISQTYQNWEMIIVDDRSNDNSAEYIQTLIENDSRIKLIVLEKNVGAAEARNKALEVAKGKYIAFLDSDDIWLPEKLEKQLDFMQKNEYAFTFTSYIPISEDGTEEYPIISVPSEIDYNGYCKNTIIGCLTVIIDKEKTGDFRMPNIKSSHDMALWLLIMKRGFKAYGLNEVLAKYRLVSTSNTSKKYKAVADAWKVYREIEKLSLIKSSWYFMHYIFNAIKKRI